MYANLMRSGHLVSLDTVPSFQMIFINQMLHLGTICHRNVLFSWWANLQYCTTTYKHLLFAMAKSLMGIMVVLRIVQTVP